MSLKLITLNIEGDKHLDLVVPFLQKERADVVCLQEVFEADMPLFSEAIGSKGTFAPTSNVIAQNRYGLAPRGRWGVALFSTLPQSSVESLYYKKDSPAVPEFVDGQPNSGDRVILLSQVENDGQRFTVGTTHFTWTGDGNISNEQINNFRTMIELLEPYPDLVLAGDFNVPRGREMFSRFTEHFTDNLPAEITTTIDKHRHFAGDIQVAVDNIFSRRNHVVSNVRIVDGVSDHMAIIGEISSNG